jgi:hypothetical protein
MARKPRGLPKILFSSYFHLKTLKNQYKPPSSLKKRSSKSLKEQKQKQNQLNLKN